MITSEYFFIFQDIIQYITTTTSKTPEFGTITQQHTINCTSTIAYIVATIADYTTITIVLHSAYAR